MQPAAYYDNQRLISRRREYLSTGSSVKIERQIALGFQNI
jgi:hypothetical protein